MIACAEECSALKKHFDECNERVENGSSENCKLKRGNVIE
jgi:ubiquinol-cytochrome c reductase subunit 6